LIDAAGNRLSENGVAAAEGVSFSFPAFGWSMMQCALPVDSIEAAVVCQDTYQPYLQAWIQPDGGTVADRVLRFQGPVWVDEVNAEQGLVMVTAFDPMIYLTKRFTLAQFSPTDLGALLKAMIDTTNSTDGETGIRTNAANITASSTIDLDARTNKPSIASLVGQFQSQLDGVESWVEPITLAAGKMCDFYAAPTRGITRSGVVFAYGEGTLANCDQMTRTRNKDLMENDSNGYADTLTATPATDATSIAAFRRLVGYTSLTGETSQAVLDARVQGRKDERYTPARIAEYKASPGVDAPQIFEDYEPGDTVTVHYREGELEWKVPQRIMLAKIPVSDNGELLPAQLDFRGVAA
jgi:hypothetical protein